MSSKEHRRRAGRGESIGGEAASDALHALVEQFSDQSAFVRELIQNSLDAGAGRVEVRAIEEDDRLRIDVEDDGEGMDRATIEGYLLTLFRSSKERDQTKIGKFGVGFVSLFALKPELVVVDTGRDGLHHRVIFDEHQEYTLALVDEPFEGTTVTLYVAGKKREREPLAQAIREAVHYWCRYARAEIWTEGQGEGWGWALEEVVHPFSVDVPLQIEERTEGMRVVMGFSEERTARVGYYNHGLTLLEADEDVVPWVSFRVEARVLEHTLTRDNVIRDRNHRAVIRRIAALARGRLRDDHLAALQFAVEAEDWKRHEALMRVVAAPPLDLPEDLPCFRTVDGNVTAINELKPSLLKRLFVNELLVASKETPLTQRFAEAGRVVLLGPPDRPELRHLAAAITAEVFEVQRNYIAPRVLEERPLIAAVQALAKRPVVAASFAGCGDAVEGQLVSWQRAPGAIEKRAVQEDTKPQAWGRRGTVLIDVHHPSYLRFEALPSRIAAPLLWYAVRRSLGETVKMDAEMMRSLMAAKETVR
ncbi:MAG: ATP-binding protein [Myxococcota bacterium]